MKVIIAGTRHFNNYSLVKEKLDYYLQNINKQDIEIVSGTANGADKLGEKYGLENNIKIIQFPANWDEYGKSAGYKRNLEMAKYATHCIVFWDGISKGTKHMIDLSKKYELKLKIVTY